MYMYPLHNRDKHLKKRRLGILPKQTVLRTVHTKACHNLHPQLVPANASKLELQPDTMQYSTILYIGGEGRGYAGTYMCRYKML